MAKTSYQRIPKANLKKRIHRPIRKELLNNHFRVSIFGSARTKTTDPEYKLAYRLGKELGKRGIDVVTGGGPGQMQAANKGHKEGRHKNSNSHSIGLAIKLPKEQKINKYVDISKEYKTFSKRLDTFMLLSNAVIVTPGGIGTILELFYTWQLIQTEKICNIPIILVGKEWEPLYDWMKHRVLKNKFIAPKDVDLIFYAKTPTQAIKIIEQTHREYQQKGENFCINFKKYKIT